jgi:predicted NBD/HSP70 family sugar kinase
VRDCCCSLFSLFQIAEKGECSSHLAQVEIKGAKEVYEAAEIGDALATKIIDETHEMLGVGCITLCRVLDPQVIIFTGGMAKAKGLIEDVNKYFRKHHWKIQEPHCKICIATTGNSAGMIGAAANARTMVRMQSRMGTSVGDAARPRTASQLF